MLPVDTFQQSWSVEGTVSLCCFARDVKTMSGWSSTHGSGMSESVYNHSCEKTLDERKGAEG